MAKIGNGYCLLPLEWQWPTHCQWRGITFVSLPVRRSLTTKVVLLIAKKWQWSIPYKKKVFMQGKTALRSRNRPGINALSPRGISITCDHTCGHVGINVFKKLPKFKENSFFHVHYYSKTMEFLWTKEQISWRYFKEQFSGWRTQSSCVHGSEQIYCSEKLNYEKGWNLKCSHEWEGRGRVDHTPSWMVLSHNYLLF